MAKKLAPFSALQKAKDYIDRMLSGKVDKVSGKGLSTNDYTTTEKNKLAGIASGAEVNVQSDWNQSTTTADDYIKNKPTNMDVLKRSVNYENTGGNHKLYRIFKVKYTSYNYLFLKFNYYGGYTTCGSCDVVIRFQPNGVIASNSLIRCYLINEYSHIYAKITNDNGVEFYIESIGSGDVGVEITHISSESNLINNVNNSNLWWFPSTLDSYDLDYITTSDITVCNMDDYNSLSNAPSSLPASDVYAWAKASTKPSYTASEVDALANTGGMLTGSLNVIPNNCHKNFDEGIRISTEPDTGYFTLLLGAPYSSDTNTEDGAFWIGGNKYTRIRKLFIGHNASTSDTYFHAESADDHSPKLHLPSGTIESGNGDAVNGGTVFNYFESSKGAANGVAELDSAGKVPSSQLPSYVDDVLEYDSKSAFPSTGEVGKIYVDKTTSLTWRWSGSAYVEISPSLALGETSSTAYRGDRGKTAYDHSQSTHARTDATAVSASSTNGNIKINGTETNVYTHPGSGTNPHGTTKSDVGLGNVGNFKAVSTIASQGLSDTEKANARTNISAASDALVTTSVKGLMSPNDKNTLNVLSARLKIRVITAQNSYNSSTGKSTVTFTLNPNDLDGYGKFYRVSSMDSTGFGCMFTFHCFAGGLNIASDKLTPNCTMTTSGNPSTGLTVTLVSSEGVGYSGQFRVKVETINY